MGAQLIPGIPQTTSSPEERSGLTKVIWYGIVGIVGLVVGPLIGIMAIGSMTTRASSLNLPTNATPAQVATALGPIFKNLTLVVPAVAALEVVGFLLLVWAFRDFAKVDDSKFSFPWKLTVILIIGVVIAAVGVIPILNDVPNIISKAPSGSGTASTAFWSAVSGLLYASLVAVIGGILALVGIFGGVILGLWRIGSRYDQTTITVGGIMTIIPGLSYVAPILILIGAYEARNHLPAQN